MGMCNVVLSTEPRGGKGGVATVIPMYIEALQVLGDTEFIPTHVGGSLLGKLWPWICSFRKLRMSMEGNRGARLVFHLHPGSGFCIIRMLLLAYFLRYRLNQRVFVYLHTPYLENYLCSGIWRTIISALINCSDRVIVLTSYALNLLVAHDLAAKAHIVPNPFGTEHVHVKKRLKDDGSVTVLVMGRLIDGKGFLETLKAMQYLPVNYRLVIAGDGELNKIIRDVISELGLGQRVTMKGWVSGDAKEDLLLSANVFCLPSTVDSFGMSFVEAQVYDVPIVAYLHPPVIEVIRKDASVFVNSLEPVVIANAIVRANNLNSEIARGSGQEWVSTMFGAERIGHLLGSIIDDLG